MHDLGDSADWIINKAGLFVSEAEGKQQTGGAKASATDTDATERSAG